MTSYLHADFETRSAVPLRGPRSVGLWNYMHHWTTKALMLAWAFDDEPVEVWEIKNPMPDKLRRGLEDDKQLLSAWNSTFERYGFNILLGMFLPIHRFVDPQASASYLSLPKDLDDVCEILGFPKELAKDKAGKKLIDMFSQLTPNKKVRGEEKTFYFRDETTNPVEWQQFIEYCRQDVVAEREVKRKLTAMKVFPLPEREQRIWIFDQTVNDRGIPVNVPWVRKAYALATRAKEEALISQEKLTGLENANSNQQMLAWAQDQGYAYNSLEKEFVASALKYNDKLTPLAKQVLEARKAASSTTYKKMGAILRQVCPDGRLRNQFLYMGSARCGRWSGNAVQLHNMARPEPRFEDLDNVDWARAMIEAEDYEAIGYWFGNACVTGTDPGCVLTVVKNCIRTSFEVAKGKRFNVCDLSAIETVVSAWFAECAGLMKVFTTYLCLDHPEYESSKPGHCGACLRRLERMDPYLDFAMKMTGIPYISLARDIKSKDPAIKAAAKRHRQIAKPGVLGCVYRLSGGKIVWVDGIQTTDGLHKYAEDMGVDMTLEESNMVVRVFREAYKEIPDMWYALERAVADVLAEGTVRVKRELGPGGCVKFDKLTLKDKLTGNRRVILRIQLPSGRYLHYVDAQIESKKMPWQRTETVNGKQVLVDVYKPCLVYAGTNQITKQWGEVTSHGGKIFENIVQGIARDVLSESLLKFENEADLPIVGHVHDEGISETDDDPLSAGPKQMETIMSRPITWAPGLPLAADGFEGKFYRKG